MKLLSLKHRNSVDRRPIDNLDEIAPHKLKNEIKRKQTNIKIQKHDF